LGLPLTTVVVNKQWTLKSAMMLKLAIKLKLAIGQPERNNIPGREFNSN